jgi:hypothetical protein
VAENTNFALAYGDDFGCSVVGGTPDKGAQHIEASASHKLDAFSAGLWYQREAFDIRYSKAEGSKIKLGFDFGYQATPEVKAIASVIRRMGSETTAADVKTDDKVRHEIWVGPSYFKDGLNAELVGVFKMDEEKAFAKDGKAADSKNAMGAMFTAGYVF